MQLKNKVAVVTGGASGIGGAIVKKFTAEGASVHILELSEVAGKDDGATYHQCDVSVHQEVKTVIQKIQSVSPIDILVNCAGIAHVGNLEKTSEGDLDKLYAVNIKGTYNCMHACIGGMIENGGGVILNMASIASSVGISERFAYSMTKGAVLTMTYSVAKDYIDKNIRCNCVSPARVHTPFVDKYLSENYPGKEKEMFEALAKTQPIGRMGTPNEVAGLVAFLCSDDAAFMTGTDYPIDGGFIKLNG